MNFIIAFIKFMISCIPFIGALWFTKWLFVIDATTWKQDIAFFIVVPLLFSLSSAIWPGKS